MRIFAKRKPQPLYKRVFRFSWRFLVGTIAFFIIALMAGYAAILISPTAISGLAEKSINDLNENIAPYKLTSEDIHLSVANIGAPVLLEAKNLSIRLDETELALIPKLSMQFGMRILPNPRFVLRYAEITSPELHADVAMAMPGSDDDVEDHAAPAEGLTPNEAKQQQPVANIDSERWQEWRKIKSRIRRLHRVIRLEALSINNGRIQLPREVLSTDAKDATLNAEITYRHKTLNGTLNLQLPPTINTDNGEAPPSMQLRLEGNPNTGNAVLTGTVDSLVMAHFSMLPMPEWIAGAGMPLHLQINGTLKHEKLEQAEIKIKTEAGTYNWPSLFPDALPVEELQSTVVVEGLGDKIHVRDTTLTLSDLTLSAELELERQKDGYGLSGKASFPLVNTDRLGAYWPLTLAPLTRTWAVSNLHDGIIKDASVKVNFTPLELTQPVIPAKSLEADMRVEGVTVQYLPNHPAAKKLVGDVHFTGRNMTVNIVSAEYMSATKVGTGNLSIPDFHDPETALTAEFDVETVAADVAKLFATPEINLAKKMNLSPSAKGTATGHVRIAAIIFSSMTPPPPSYFTDHFDYEVTADTKDLAQPKFMNETDISNADLHIEAATEALLIEGQLALFGVPAKLKLNGDFTTDETRTEVIMDLPATKLADFGYPIRQGVEGTLGVTAVMAQTAKDDKTTTTINLTNAALSLPEAGMTKAKGDKGTLVMTTRVNTAGQTQIESLAVDAPNTKIRAKGLLDKDGTPLTLEIPELQSGRQHATISYSQSKDGPVLRANGESLDLWPWRKMQEDAAKGQPKKAGNPLDMGALDARVQLQKLWLGPEVPIYEANILLRCTKQRCVDADIRGKVPSTADEGKSALAPFSLRIDGVSKRKFSLEADDVGRLLEALDVSNHIRGGKAKVDAVYQDSEVGQPLSGKIRVKDFYLQQAPLLTKVLSLTSPLGIVNALSGKGINFNTFAADFTFTEGTVDLKETRANGSALGFTTQGQVQLGSEELKLDGTVVPAYMINSAIGNIPLVGELLTGGKGEGIIATNYGVTGTYADPKISVNPLSMLTPGFLRGFFDIFDNTSTDSNGNPAVTDPRGTTKERPDINKNDQPAAKSAETKAE